jgi:hypothetical protein
VDLHPPEDRAPKELPHRVRSPALPLQGCHALRVEVLDDLEGRLSGDGPVNGLPDDRRRLRVEDEPVSGAVQPQGRLPAEGRQAAPVPALPDHVGDGLREPRRDHRRFHLGEALEDVGEERLFRIGEVEPVRHAHEAHAVILGLLGQPTPVEDVARDPVDFGEDEDLDLVPSVTDLEQARPVEPEALVRSRDVEVLDHLDDLVAVHRAPLATLLFLARR